MLACQGKRDWTVVGGGAAKSEAEPAKLGALLLLRSTLDLMWGQDFHAASLASSQQCLICWSTRSKALRRAEGDPPVGVIISASLGRSSRACVRLKNIANRRPWLVTL